jgi:hypothetical protein
MGEIMKEDKKDNFDFEEKEYDIEDSKFIVIFNMVLLVLVLILFAITCICWFNIFNSKNDNNDIIGEYVIEDIYSEKTNDTITYYIKASDIRNPIEITKSDFFKYKVGDTITVKIKNNRAYIIPRSK